MGGNLYVIGTRVVTKEFILCHFHSRPRRVYLILSFYSHPHLCLCRTQNKFLLSSSLVSFLFTFFSSLLFLFSWLKREFRIKTTIDLVCSGGPWTSKCHVSIRTISHPKFHHSEGCPRCTSPCPRTTNASRTENRGSRSKGSCIGLCLLYKTFTNSLRGHKTKNTVRTNSVRGGSDTTGVKIRV